MQEMAQEHNTNALRERSLDALSLVVFDPRYMGLQPSMYGTHLLSSCVYLALG